MKVSFAFYCRGFKGLMTVVQSLSAVIILSFGKALITFGFLKAPPSVRSLVLSDVSRPDGVGEDKLLTRPGSALPGVKLSPAPLFWPEEPGTVAASPESVILRYLGLLSISEFFSTRGFHATKTLLLCNYITW